MSSVHPEIRDFKMGPSTISIQYSTKPAFYLPSAEAHSLNVDRSHAERFVSGRSLPAKQKGTQFIPTNLLRKAVYYEKVRSKKE